MRTAVDRFWGECATTIQVIALHVAPLVQADGPATWAGGLCRISFVVYLLIVRHHQIYPAFRLTQHTTETHCANTIFFSLTSLSLCSACRRVCEHGTMYKRNFNITRIDVFRAIMRGFENSQPVFMWIISSFWMGPFAYVCSTLYGRFVWASIPSDNNAITYLPLQNDAQVRRRSDGMAISLCKFQCSSSQVLSGQKNAHQIPHKMT